MTWVQPSRKMEIIFQQWQEIKSDEWETLVLLREVPCGLLVLGVSSSVLLLLLWSKVKKSYPGDDKSVLHVEAHQCAGLMVWVQFQDPLSSVPLVIHFLILAHIPLSLYLNLPPVSLLNFFLIWTYSALQKVEKSLFHEVVKDETESVYL